MGIVLDWLVDYEYLAMVGILTLCGVGLPMPEEVTLISSGLLVGWHEADFWLTSLACSLGILMGDSIIFGLGHHYGQRFLQSRPMRFLLPEKRLHRVHDFFENHGNKALFLCRFVPGVRIGVYSYAGSQRIPWARFLVLDGLGVAISAPLSIWAGRWAGAAFADNREQAFAMAVERAHRIGHWVLIGAVCAVMTVMLTQALLRRRRDRPAAAITAPGKVTKSPEL